mmetsp:Transcript_23434/g.55644  ORF Transcript_23434/g.55644 Transcript_23434/m.55644 type:complete len:424 (-) Transcript_23434:157-1428(-)
MELKDVELPGLGDEAAPRHAVAGSSCKIDLCVLVHGMSGDCTDWDIWFQVLSSQYPSWKVVALQSLARGARCLASGVDQLAGMAADEIIHLINVERACFDLPVRLHVIGHSLGGIIIRGALPSILKEFEKDCLQLGHYMSLSTPHLGIRASWTSPHHAWRNLLGPLTSCLTPQLAQLCVSDGPGQAYLQALSDPSGPFVMALRRFHCRTCATVADGDPLVSMASGIIDPLSHAAKVQQVEASKAPEPTAGALRWLRLPEGICCRRKRSSWSLTQRGAEANCFAPASLKRGSASMSTPCNSSGRSLWAEESTDLEDGEVDESASSGRTISTCSSFTVMATGSRGSINCTESPWSKSRDGKCKYPDCLLEGLASLPWRRLVVALGRGPLASNAHVFLLAKKRHQWPEEHIASRSCVELLAQLLRD